MDAVVLLGGEGTRLRPLTYEIPKQMLPVVGRPMIVHVLDWLAGHGVDRVVLSLGYRPDTFLEAFPSNQSPESLSCTRSSLSRSTPPAPCASPRIRLASTTRFSSSTATCSRISTSSALVEFHLSREADASIALTPVPDPSAFGVVPTDDRRPSYRLHREAASGPSPDEPDQRRHLRAGHLGPGPDPRRQARVDRTRDLPRTGGGPQVVRARVGRVLGRYRDSAAVPPSTARHPRRAPPPPWSPRPPRSGQESGSTRVLLWPASSARTPSSAARRRSPKEPSWKTAPSASAAAVGVDAVVRRSVLMAGAEVRGLAVVEDSVVGPHAVVGGGARLSGGTVVGVRAEVPPGSMLDGARYPSV